MGKWFVIILNLIDDSESGEGEGFSQPDTSNNHIGMFPRKQVECLQVSLLSSQGSSNGSDETCAGMVGMLASPRAKINQTEIISPINDCWAIK